MSPWGGVTGKFTKNVTFSASAAAEAVIATMKLTAAGCGRIPVPFERLVYGYTSQGYGALSPNTFKYNGVQYTIDRLAAENITKRIHLYFTAAPSFSAVVLDIDGTEFTLTQNSSEKEGFFGIGITFTEGTTYTVKIKSVS